MNRLPYIAVFFAAVLLVAADKEPKEAKEPSPSPQQIQAWIKQLGDESFKIREEATRDLLNAGGVAFDAVTKATKSKDFEVKQRALRIVKQIETFLPINEMRRLLRDGAEPETRGNMAYQIGRSRKLKNDNIVVLIEALENDPSYEVQRKASESLGVLMGFEKFFDKDNPEQRAKAVEFYRMLWKHIKDTPTQRRLQKAHEKGLRRRNP